MRIGWFPDGQRICVRLFVVWEPCVAPVLVPLCCRARLSDYTFGIERRIPIPMTDLRRLALTKGLAPCWRCKVFGTDAWLGLSNVEARRRVDAIRYTALERIARAFLVCVSRTLSL